MAARRRPAAGALFSAPPRPQGLALQAMPGAPIGLRRHEALGEQSLTPSSSIRATSATRGLRKPDIVSGMF